MTDGEVVHSYKLLSKEPNLKTSNNFNCFLKTLYQQFSKTYILREILTAHGMSTDEKLMKKMYANK